MMLLILKYQYYQQNPCK